MKIDSLSVKNFQSLKEVKIEGLGLFSVIIGKNNSGKSSALKALQFLTKAITGSNLLAEPVRSITNRDRSLSLEIHITIEFDKTEREEYLRILYPQADAESRILQMLEGRFARKAQFSFVSRVGDPQSLFLHAGYLMAEDGNMARIYRLKGSDDNFTTMYELIDIKQITNSNLSQILHAHTIESAAKANVNLQVTRLDGHFNKETSLFWPGSKLVSFLKNGFFFDPFRHSEIRQSVHNTPVLNQSGTNLPQVLLTLLANDKRRFEKIEAFMQSALPHIGHLQTPLIEALTEVQFLTPAGFHARLNEMGGGVEQLLMVAVVLYTTGKECPIFIEEPENHLHAGAQRFLIEQLNTDGRQVIITTHSPVFVNSPHIKGIHLVKFDGSTSQITRIENGAELSEVFDEIGARNSDLLLSDAVLFVEGPSDKKCIEIISEKIGMPFNKFNVTILPMGGGEYAIRSAPMRSELMHGISTRTPVPHTFLIDKDERNTADIKRITTKLKAKLHVTKSRELENYLIKPSALRKTLQDKLDGNQTNLQKLEDTSDAKILELAQEFAEELYGLVLLKRIRARLGGLKDGMLTREMINDLLPFVDSKKIGAKIQAAIRKRFREYFNEYDLDKIVKTERARLDKEWTSTKKKLMLAPGEEILSKIFMYFGSTYSKADAPKIASHLLAHEIESDLKSLIRYVVELSKPNN